jgi:hypothetical protein
MKYFFDLVGQQQSEYDYQGRVFSASVGALKLAELMALNLEFEGQGKWSGWRINVRDAYGRQFFSIPIQEADLIAA